MNAMREKNAGICRGKQGSIFNHGSSRRSLRKTKTFQKLSWKVTVNIIYTPYKKNGDAHLKRANRWYSNGMERKLLFSHQLITIL